MLARIEALLMIIGTALLLGCAAVVWIRGMSANAMIERFEDARDNSVAAPVAHLASDVTSPLPGPSPDRTPPAAGDGQAVPDAVLSVLPPDQSDWSDTRRARYVHASTHTELPLAILRIPRIALEVPVLAGSRADTLEMGVGWLERTAFPGGLGNAAVAGHRDSFFRRLGGLSPGDRIELETLEGRFDFRVVDHTIAEPDDVSVLSPRPGKKRLTLITCYPFRYVGNAPKRYIVRAEIVE